MGLFGLFQSEEDKRAEEIRKGTVAPTRAERQKCWASRDLFYACLDKHNIIDPIKDEKAATKKCSSENAAFERDCAAQWVCYLPTS